MAINKLRTKSLWLQLKSFFYLRLQTGPNTLQQNEYGGVVDFLARYLEDRSKYSPIREE